MLLNKVRWLFHFFGHHISQRCLRPRHVALVTASFPTSATADGRLPLGWANSARSEPDETAGLARSNHGNLEHQRWKFKLLRPSFWSCSLCDGYIFPRSKAVAGHFLLFSRKKNRNTPEFCQCSPQKRSCRPCREPTGLLAMPLPRLGPGEILDVQSVNSCGKANRERLARDPNCRFVIWYGCY